MPNQKRSQVIAQGTSIPTVTITQSPIKAEKAVVADIHDIRMGLSNLPGDIANLLEGVEERIDGLESLINSILRGASSSSSLKASSSSTHYLTDITPIPARSTASSYPTSESTGRFDSSNIYTTLSRSSLNRVYGGLGKAASYPTYSNTSATASLTTASAVTLALQYASSLTPAVAITSASTPTTISPSSSAPYTFDAQATDNVAIYFGQTGNTSAGQLLELCEDVNVDIVILAFVYDFFGSGGYPDAEFGQACWAGPNAQAPDLANCTALASDISTCQAIGKKVLVSIGGERGSSNFESDTQAEEFAATLWNLFGAGANGTNLRPFGSGVVVDGFDVDNEHDHPEFYDTFASALRQWFAQDTSKTYYLSAALQCPMPDASTPAALMWEADFVWVQFYNNPPCELGTSEFPSSFAAWSEMLLNGSTIAGKPRLYVGAPASPQAATNGYVSGSGLASVMDEVLGLNVSNMGGIMLWDGSQAWANIDASGTNYLQYAKMALQE